METTRTTRRITKETVRQTVAEYFGKVNHDIDIQMMRGVVLVDLTYTDFNPIRIVRKDLQSLIPQIEFQSLVREYSNEAIHEALDEIMCNEHPIFVVDEDNQSMRETTLYNLASEYLFARTYRHE